MSDNRYSRRIIYLLQEQGNIVIVKSLLLQKGCSIGCSWIVLTNDDAWKYNMPGVQSIVLIELRGRKGNNGARQNTAYNSRIYVDRHC